MKTHELHQDEKTELEETRTTEEHRWTQMERTAGARHESSDGAPARKRFPIRASEGSSIFKLLFP